MAGGILLIRMHFLRWLTVECWLWVIWASVGDWLGVWTRWNQHQQSVWGQWPNGCTEKENSFTYAADNNPFFLHFIAINQHIWKVRLYLVCTWFTLSIEPLLQTINMFAVVNTNYWIWRTLQDNTQWIRRFFNPFASTTHTILAKLLLK